MRSPTTLFMLLCAIAGPALAGQPGSLAEIKKLEEQSTISQLLTGGEVSAYWSAHIARHMRTAVVPRRQATRALMAKPDATLGKLSAESRLGHLSLDEFLSDRRSGARGFIVVHRGRIVHERYPGMRPDDSLLWASGAKTMTSLLIDLLVDEGKIDVQRPIDDYLPDFRGTAWEGIRVLDILDMTPGLDTEENDETRRNPDSLAIRLFLADLGVPNRRTGQTETVREVIKSAKKIREPGTSFDYGSPVTQALVFLTEEVAQQRWADLLDERVWSKLYADGPIQIHLSPDGTAAPYGLVSSRLRDMARFAMLYTPSWKQVASERIVTPAMIQRIRDGVRSHEFYMRGFDGPVFSERLNETIVSNSRQWDAVFADGDFFKSGFMGQGIYVSPDRDLVIAYFSTSPDQGSIQRYLRPLAKRFPARKQ